VKKKKKKNREKRLIREKVRDFHHERMENNQYIN
jgi:RNase P protein component